MAAIFLSVISSLLTQNKGGGEGRAPRAPPLDSPLVLVSLVHQFDRVIANEPAERRRSAGEAAENSAARRMAYAKKFSIEL